MLLWGPARQPAAYVLENSCNNLVTCFLSNPAKPLEAAVVVPAQSHMTVSPGPPYSVSAVVNGLTTASVAVKRPSATVTAVEGSGPRGCYILMVS